MALPDRLSSIAGIPVVWIPSPTSNYGVNRGPVDLIVIHDIEGSAQSGIDTLSDPAREASTHLITDAARNRFVQMVGLYSTAWTTGNSDVNRRSLNIENPGFHGRPYDPAVVRLCGLAVGEFARAFAVPLVRVRRQDILAGARGVCGHEDVPNPYNPAMGGGSDGHTDPGPTWPWDEMFSYAREGGVPAGDTPDRHWFSATGFAIRSGFLAYWREFGGLSVFGYPLSREIATRDAGGAVTYQWFERARFEWRKGQAPDRFDVVLGRVGAEVLEYVRAQLDYPSAFVPESETGR